MARRLRRIDPRPLTDLDRVVLRQPVAAGAVLEALWELVMARRVRLSLQCGNYTGTC